MVHTIEAEVDIDGVVRTLKPIRVKRRTRAIVTLLEELKSSDTEPGNAKLVLKFLQNNRLEPGSRLSPEEIDAQITEARESWD